LDVVARINEVGDTTNQIKVHPTEKCGVVRGRNRLEARFLPLGGKPRVDTLAQGQHFVLVLLAAGLLSRCRSCQYGRHESGYYPGKTRSAHHGPGPRVWKESRFPYLRRSRGGDATNFREDLDQAWVDV